MKSEVHIAGMPASSREGAKAFLRKARAGFLQMAVSGAVIVS